MTNKTIRQAAQGHTVEPGGSGPDSQGLQDQEGSFKALAPKRAAAAEAGFQKVGDQTMHRIKTLALLTACLMLALAGTAMADPTTLYEQGFETGMDDWKSYSSELTRIQNGSTGIQPSSGNWHLELTDPDTPPSGYNSGAYAFLGGSRTSFGGGWGVSIDVYIDLNDSNIELGTYGFDMTQSIYNTSGEHGQDNIFHVGAADPDDDETYTVFVNASHNTDYYNNDWKLVRSEQRYDSTEDPGEFTTSGWYTFGIDFAPSLERAGYVEVTFSVTDPTDMLFWSADWTTEKYTLDNAGGNGYLWFTYAEADRLAIDNVNLQIQPVPLPPSALMLLTGVMGVGGFGVWRKRRGC